MTLRLEASGAEPDTSHRVDGSAAHSRVIRRPRRLTIVLGLLVLAVAAVISAASVDSDSGHDLLGLARAVGGDLLRLRWQYTSVVVVLAIAHYLATAFAARAAATVRLPLREITVVQLAAAAANRVTPAGLGGSAVTARYFTRRGMDIRAAVGAVALLGILGAAADLAVLALLVFAGRTLGLGGGGGELRLLWAKVSGLVAPFRSQWTWIALGVVVPAAIAGYLLLRRRHLRQARLGRENSWAPLADLTHRPRALAVLLTASASTTLILAFAFVAATAMVPGPRPQETLGAALVGFMAASAAGSAVPVPAGLGSTEAALIGVLVAARVPAAHAVEVVLLYRVVTFWLPAMAGVLATRYLRRIDAV